MLHKIKAFKERISVEDGDIALGALMIMMVVAVFGGITMFATMAPKNLIESKFQAMGNTFESWSVSHPEKHLAGTGDYKRYEDFEKKLLEQGIALKNFGFDENGDFLKLQKTSGENYIICGYPSTAKRDDGSIKHSYIYDSISGEAKNIDSNACP